jgi:hypothetical protein
MLIQINTLTPELFLELYTSVGWEAPGIEQVQRALDCFLHALSSPISFLYLHEKNSLSGAFLCVLTLIIVLLQIAVQRFAFFKMSIAFHNSGFAFCKRGFAKSEVGLQNSMGVCKLAS